MNLAKEAQDTIDKATSGSGIISGLARAGLKSEYCYAAAFVSIGLSWVSYAVSRGKKGDDKAQSDRWGIYVGHWAPTLFAMGIALKLEE